MKQLFEKQIEDVFEVFYEQLLEPNLSLIARQHILENRLRVDLLFKDKNGKTVVLELKKDAISREDIGQIMQYAGLIKNSRVILAAPIISSSIKIAFEHYGIEYLEFNMTEITNLYNRIKNKPQGQKSEMLREIKINQNTIKEPLQSRTKKDGNVAFKVTYTDRDWSGVCLPKVAAFNFKNRRWCGIQSKRKINCQSKRYKASSKLNSDFSPCYDCIAKKELLFYPGHNHGYKYHNKPKRCLYAKIGRLALFTSREPGSPENERFIFAIGRMQYFRTVEDEQGNYECFHCDKETALYFNEGHYPKFWKYYSNPNNPDSIAWGTGLIRYVTDDIVYQLLKDITNSEDYSGEQRKKAELLLMEGYKK
jgi:hypothetical protein